MVCLRSSFAYLLRLRPEMAKNELKIGALDCVIDLSVIFHGITLVVLGLIYILYLCELSNRLHN